MLRNQKRLCTVVVIGSPARSTRRASLAEWFSSLPAFVRGAICWMIAGVAVVLALLAIAGVEEVFG